MADGKAKIYRRNARAASEVFAKHGSLIRAVIRSQTKDEAQADDIFQNLFLSLIQAPIPNRVKNIQAYLYRAITNDAADVFRKRETHRTLIQNFGKRCDYPINKYRPENALMVKEQIDEMLKLMQTRLPRGQTEAILLRYWHQNGNKEIAEKLGVKVRTVSRYISVGVKRIRQLLAATKDD